MDGTEAKGMVVSEELAIISSSSFISQLGDIDVGLQKPRVCSEPETIQRGMHRSMSVSGCRRG